MFLVEEGGVRMERRGKNISAENSQRLKKTKRKELLSKKKAVDDAIRAASSVNDHLALFPPFRNYSRNGLDVYFKSGSGSKLSSSLKQYIASLLKINMEVPYGSEWPVEANVKKRETVDPDARYIFVYKPNSSSTPVPMEEDHSPVGFLHFRFVIEEEIPVLYVYELQLEDRVQNKGLGKFLMQLIELIAHKNRMGAVVLTVQKTNTLAMNFYTKKLRYNISSISPSRVDPLMGLGKSYEILCKAFDDEAKSALSLSS